MASHYSRSATEAFLNAARAGTVESMMRYLDSRAFATQTASFFEKRWEKASTEAVIADISTGKIENYHFDASGRDWALLDIFIDAKKIELIPLHAIKAVPVDILQRYRYKMQQTMIVGYETGLSACLKRKTLPAEYKSYFKTLPNLVDKPWIAPKYDF